MQKQLIDVVKMVKLQKLPESRARIYTLQCMNRSTAATLFQEAPLVGSRRWLISQYLQRLRQHVSLTYIIELPGWLQNSFDRETKLCHMYMT